MQTEVTDLRKQMEELRTQLQRNEEMVRWLNNQVRPCSNQASLFACPIIRGQGTLNGPVSSGRKVATTGAEISASLDYD